MAGTFSETVRQLMREGDVGLRELARRVHYTPGHLSNVLNGRKTVAAAFAIALDRELGAGGAVIAAAAIASGSPVDELRSGQWGHAEASALPGMLTAAADTQTAMRLSHHWLVTDSPQITEIRAGRRVGTTLANEVEQRVIALRRLDDHVGGDDLAVVVRTELADTLTLLSDGSFTTEIGRRLLTCAGELAQLAGWTLSDAGAHHSAAQAYVTGVHAAHAAGDTALAANLLSSLSYQLANTGEQADAVLLARTACQGARQQATPRTVALLADRVAWACARAGLPDGVDRALGQADEAWSRVDGAEDPDWVYWVTRDELDVMAGRCYAEQRRPLKAEPLLASVLLRYDPTHARERALYLTWLADTYLWAGEADQAAVTATEALDLTEQVHSWRTRNRIAAVARHLARHSSSTIRSFVDRVNAGDHIPSAQPTQD